MTGDVRACAMSRRLYELSDEELRRAIRVADYALERAGEAGRQAALRRWLQLEVELIRRRLLEGARRSEVEERSRR